ncbi:MAG: DUF2807 domain-containing protein [Hyphomonas sp.]
MNRTTACLAALTLLATPTALAETKSYAAQPFDEIEAGGAIDVIYERADTPSIRVEQADGDFSDLYLDFDGDTLVVSRNSVRDRSGWFKNVSIRVKDNRKIVKVNGKQVPYYLVRVSGPRLDGVQAKSSAKLVVNGLESDNFSARASSSGDLELNGMAAKAQLHASSSGDILARDLTTDFLDIHASSSGDVEVKALGVSRVKIEASSSGDVELESRDGAEYTIEASSSADVELEGSCSSINVEASSSADVDANGLQCKEANVTASSSADVSVYASDSVTAQASSSGDIYVVGSPSIRDVTRSSGGDVDFGN